MKALTSIVFVLFSLFAVAQSQRDLDGIDVSFLFAEKIAKDSSDLTFKIVFHNTSPKISFIYSALVHGKPNDEDCNLYVDLEKFNGNEYKSYSLGFYHKMSETKTDTICRDIAKRVLQPLSSDTLSCNLLTIGNYFETGRYRFKVHLRKRCKIILPKGDGDTWYSEINYIESKWLYFQADNDIFKKQLIVGEAGAKFEHEPNGY